MSVQIKPCTDDDGCVSWCDESEAAYFGVYLGEQGAYVWLADFASKDEANWYAEIVSTKQKGEEE